MFNNILKTTTISSYTEKDAQYIIDFCHSNHPKDLINELRYVFHKDITSQKVSVTLTEHSTKPELTILLLQGLFYWDNIPVTNINIVFDALSCSITSIQSVLFTFMGNAYMSNLGGIHRTMKTPAVCQLHTEDSCLTVDFGTAVKTYKKDENGVLISFFVSPRKLI